MMKRILILIADIIIAFCVIIAVIYGEYKLWYAIMEEEYFEWGLIIMIATFFGLVFLNGKIVGVLLPNLGEVRNPNYLKTDDGDEEL